jgi:hypothetical protein
MLNANRAGLDRHLDNTGWKVVVDGAPAIAVLIRF